MHASSPLPLHTRSPARVRSTPERSALPDPRRWWLQQARAWLRQARLWSERLGGPDHEIAAHWYLHALLEADRYHRWAHELAPALLQVDALLERAS